MKAVVAFALLFGCVLLLACSSTAHSPTPSPVEPPAASPTLPPAGEPGLTDSPTAPPATVPAGGQVTGTATDILNVRAGPGLNYAVKGQLKVGDTITIVGKSADGIWWQYSGGWVSTTYIRVSGDAAAVPVSTPGP